jgi:preprotein translocase subunit SecD
MPKTDELQQRFDGALASLPAPFPPEPLGLHKRLRRRKMRIRIVGLTSISLVAVAALSLALTDAPKTPAGAVTLRVTTGATMSEKQLQADVLVLRNRLVAVGDHHAHVSISGRSIVVSGGPAQLRDKNSPLLASPALLVRPVLCLSGPYNGSPDLASGTPSASCVDTPSQLRPVIPTGGSGFVEPNYSNDPALASFPSTTPSHDSANPSGFALLPRAGSGEVRYLVGPVELTLTSKVASAQVSQNKSGEWIVSIQLSPSVATQLDRVAHQYFHGYLGVDLNGQIVSTPVIEPTQTGYTSFDARLEISGGLTQAGAEAIAAALQSGPLPIPLQLG